MSTWGVTWGAKEGRRCRGPLSRNWQWIICCRVGIKTQRGGQPRGTAPPGQPPVIAFPCPPRHDINSSTRTRGTVWPVPQSSFLFLVSFSKKFCRRTWWYSTFSSGLWSSPSQRIAEIGGGVTQRLLDEKMCKTILVYFLLHTSREHTHFQRQEESRPPWESLRIRNEDCDSITI